MFSLPASYISLNDDFHLPLIPPGGDSLNDVYIFSEGDMETTRNERWFIYRSTINFTLSKNSSGNGSSDGGSGGCNAGFGLLALIGLAMAGVFLSGKHK